jgi:uncharacterized membrane protein
MKDRWSLLALVMLVGGLALVAYALLTPVALGGGGHMGDITRTAYEALNIVLAILGTAMAAVSGTALIAPRMVAGPPPRRSHEVPVTEATTGVAPAAEGEGVRTSHTATAPDDNRLILRLLTGDEREVFRLLVDAGGEQLQRDIVADSNMSDAKVSRVLDRLEEKGLVARERRGMGNMIRIAVDRD